MTLAQRSASVDESSVNNHRMPQCQLRDIVGRETSECHLPIEAQVAGMTCDATVHQCGDEVLAKYVAHLVEHDTISQLASEKINNDALIHLVPPLLTV